MSARIGAVVLAVLLVLYLVLVGDRAIRFLLTGEPLGIGIGVALILLPLVGAWALVRELLFGVRAERLGQQLEREGLLPEEEVPVRPSGRVEREAADALFPAYRADVEAAPDRWQGWYRLGLVYDAAGDRKRARQAIRTAIDRSRGVR